MGEKMVLYHIAKTTSTAIFIRLNKVVKKPYLLWLGCSKAHRVCSYLFIWSLLI